MSNRIPVESIAIGLTAGLIAATQVEVYGDQVHSDAALYGGMVACAVTGVSLIVTSLSGGAPLNSSY